MKKSLPSYEVQDIPTFIQEVLMKYGEKEHIGQSEYLRVFSQDVLNKLKEQFGIRVLGQVVEHSNSYLVHSNDGKTSRWVNTLTNNEFVTEGFYSL